MLAPNWRRASRRQIGPPETNPLSRTGPRLGPHRATGAGDVLDEPEVEQNPAARPAERSHPTLGENQERIANRCMAVRQDLLGTEPRVKPEANVELLVETEVNEVLLEGRGISQTVSVSAAPADRSPRSRCRRSRRRPSAARSERDGSRNRHPSRTRPTQQGCTSVHDQSPFRLYPQHRDTVDEIKVAKTDDEQAIVNTARLNRSLLPGCYFSLPRAVSTTSSARIESDVSCRHAHRLRAGGNRSSLMLGADGTNSSITAERDACK
jgi:hypothetical protein